MLVLVAHDILNWLACIAKEDILAARVVGQELCNVVHLSLVGDPAAGSPDMFFEVLGRVDSDPFRHVGEKQDLFQSALPF